MLGLSGGGPKHYENLIRRGEYRVDATITVPPSAVGDRQPIALGERRREGGRQSTDRRCGTARRSRREQNPDPIRQLLRMGIDQRPVETVASGRQQRHQSGVQSQLGVQREGAAGGVELEQQRSNVFAGGNRCKSSGRCGRAGCTLSGDDRDERHRDPTTTRLIRPSAPAAAMRAADSSATESETTRAPEPTGGSAISCTSPTPSSATPGVSSGDSE